MTERIEWIETPDRFRTVAGAWNALVANEPTPFGDHAWFDCWWHAFGDGAVLKVCALWRGDELAAVLPLAARRRHLAALANYHSPLFRAPARDRRALDRVVAAALDTAPDDMQLHGVPVGDPTLDAIRRASRGRHRIVLSESQHVSPIVDTRGDFGDYTRKRKSRLATVLRRRRKLSREHNVDFVLDEHPTDLDAALDAGFVLEAVDWKAARGTAIRDSPETMAFYRRIAHAYAARGELRLAWLHVDGRAVAFCLLLVRGARVFLLKQGFDTSMRKAAPGLVLTLCIVERCFHLGYDAYELLGDEEDWKRLFATGQRSHERIWSFRLAPVPVGRYAFRRVGLPAARAYRTRRDGAGKRSRPDDRHPQEATNR
jgi:CelD/BcsL family acetyltransferase involved in cellulose biosynthesis